jgi:hypothetical protein
MKKDFRRLRPMTRDELMWRVRVLARTQAQRVITRVQPPRWDRRRLGRALAEGAIDPALRHAMAGEDWLTVNQELVRRLAGRPARFVLDPASAKTLVAEVHARWPDAASNAAERADRVLAGQYDLLGYRGLTFAHADADVDWHLDPVHDCRAPAVFWADVPYLDSSIGDHKVIWEINRHQYWLQLGRALWLTGDCRYASAIVEHLESWLAANPPLVGINWASMLEVGLRAISWVWALNFLLVTTRGDRQPSLPAMDRTPWLVDMLIALDRQLTHVEQNLSYYFSPNTHLTGEALALYVVGLALPELGASHRWADRGRSILLREIDRQIHTDGGHAEGSTHYHRYTLDIYLFALLTATQAEDAEAIPRFADAVKRLAEFARAMANDRGLFPLIGDDDGGMLWPITGRACHDVRDSLALAAVVLGRPDLTLWGPSEEVFWIGGPSAIESAERIDAGKDPAENRSSRTFRDTGYFIARDTNGGHAVFDVGRHGYLNGGHAHADALSLTLSVNHRPLLIDAGTSTYTTDPALRDRLRSSASHNTVTIDGRPQSIACGPFHWRTRANARLRASQHNAGFDWAEASHDGYAPLGHHRSFLRTSSGWLVLDQIVGDGPHTAVAHWLFDPTWTATEDGPGRLRVTHVDGDVAWLLHDPGTDCLVRGHRPSGLGWCAPVYGTLVPTWAVGVACEGIAPFDLVTWIGVSGGGGSPTLERLRTTSDGFGPAVAACVTNGDRASEFLLRPGDTAGRAARDAETPHYRTNARVLHHVTVAGTWLALDLIDATEARALGDRRISVASDDGIVDLHVQLDHRVLDLRASEPPAHLRLHGETLSGVRAIRLNGRELELPLEQRDTLLVAGGQWRPDARSDGPCAGA